MLLHDNKPNVYEPRSLTRAKVRRIPAFLSVVLTTYVTILYFPVFVNLFFAHSRHIIPGTSFPAHSFTARSPPAVKRQGTKRILRRTAQAPYFLSAAVPSLHTGPCSIGAGPAFPPGGLFNYRSLKLPHSVWPTALAPSPRMEIRSARHW